MLYYIVSVIYTKVLIRIDRKIHLKEKALEKWKDRRHHVAVISEGFEFHFMMTYIFPITHGAVAFFAAHATMFGFLLKLYGGGG